MFRSNFICFADYKFRFTDDKHFGIYCILFCFKYSLYISSIVYIFNDIADIESDKVHKKKRFRPLASGEVKIKEALIFAFILSILTVLICFNLNYKFIIILCLYLVINLYYVYIL